MDEKTLRRIRKLGLKEEDFEPKKEEKVIGISREDFDLLDVEEEATYHIFEEDGTMNIKKGQNV